MIGKRLSKIFTNKYECLEMIVDIKLSPVGNELAVLLGEE